MNDITEPRRAHAEEDGRTLHRAALLMGSPASERREQVRMLESAPGLVGVQMAELLEKSAHWSTGRGERVRAHLDRGGALPDDYVVRILVEHLAALTDSGAYTPGRDLLILEGVPHNAEQAALLEPRLNMELVLHLRVEPPPSPAGSDLREGTEGRRKPEPGGRDARETDPQSPDRPEEALLEHYPHSHVVELDARQSPLRVHRDILEQLLRLEELAAGHGTG